MTAALWTWSLSGRQLVTVVETDKRSHMVGAPQVIILDQRAFVRERDDVYIEVVTQALR